MVQKKSKKKVVTFVKAKHETAVKAMSIGPQKRVRLEIEDLESKVLVLEDSRLSCILPDLNLEIMDRGGTVKLAGKLTLEITGTVEYDE
jgi:hypothetical protein